MAFKFNWDKDLLDVTYVEQLRNDLNKALEKAIVKSSTIRSLEVTMLDMGTQVYIYIYIYIYFIILSLFLRPQFRIYIFFSLCLSLIGSYASNSWG